MLTLQGTGLSSMACAIAVVVVVLRQMQSSLFRCPKNIRGHHRHPKLEGGHAQWSVQLPSKYTVLDSIRKVCLEHKPTKILVSIEINVFMNC